MINKRIFGSDLPIKVKKKLEARQFLAEKARPGESIKSKYPDDNPTSGNYPYSEFIDNEFDNQAELSSRTPFVRMWTAIEIFDREISEEIVSEFKIENYVDNNSIVGPELQTSVGGTAFTESEGMAGFVSDTLKNASVIYDSDSKQHIVRGDWVTHDKVSFGKRIYVVGNHTLNTHASNPNESLNLKYEPGTTDKTELVPNSSIYTDDVIPAEFGTNDNEFMKPPAGITGFSSTTEGTLGVIKKTTVNFTVHNFHDFDKIYQRYFLRPGAQIFVDFGWNTEVLYDPKHVVFDKKKNGVGEHHGSVEELLYGELGDDRFDEDGKKLKDGLPYNGYVTDSQGDLDTVAGWVTNYDAKILENGSVECSVEITSKNAALLGETLDDEGKKRKRLEHVLSTGILYYGLYAMSSTKQRKKLKRQLQQLNPKTKADFEQGILENASDYFWLQNLKLSNKNVKSGVGINSLGDENIYISWGFFEDLVINPEFGFGESEKDISNGTDLQVRMDSTESFVTYKSILQTRQTVMGYTREKIPDFLYPTNWDDTYNTGKGKVSTNYPKELHVTTTEFDMKMNRIPLREIFVNVSILKSALNEKTISNALKLISNRLNTNSGGVFDLYPANNGSDNTISLVDYNYYHLGKSHTEKEEEESVFNKLFEFDVMSPNSIVKGYDLNFNMPDGGIANMIAIQSMASDNSKQIFPINSLMDDALATEALMSLVPMSTDEKELTKFKRLGTGYFPKIGTHRADKLYSDTRIDSKIAYGYDRVDEILDEEQPLSVDSLIINEKLFVSDAGRVGSSTSDKKGVSHTQIINTISEQEEMGGFTIAQNASDYYILQVKKEFLSEERSTPLPLKLTLTIYGISSIQPGDIFKVSYLPELYTKNVYFQVMKVSNVIDSSGWSTTLETQFRIKPLNKIKSNLYYTPKDILLPRTLLDAMNIKTISQFQYFYDASILGKHKYIDVLSNLSGLTEYMTQIKPLKGDEHSAKYDLAFRFKATDNQNIKAQGKSNIIETGITYTFDFSIRDTDASPSLDGLNTTINSDLWSWVEKNLPAEPFGGAYGKLYGPRISYAEHWPGGKSQSIYQKDGDKYKHLVPHVPEINLIRGNNYILYIKGTRWVIVDMSDIQLEPGDSDLSTNHAIYLLNAGTPTSITSSEDFEKWDNRIGCDKCAQEYLDYIDSNGTPINKLDITAQENICENIIGGEDTNYCVWEDTTEFAIHQFNTCKPNTELAGCN